MTEQQAFACAIYPPMLAKLAGMELSSYQEQAIASPESYQLWNWARQVGKSTAASIKILWTMLFEPESLTLAAAPKLDQSKLLLKSVLRLYKALGKPIPLTTLNAESIEMVNGSRFQVVPDVDSTSRGYAGVRLLVIDEAARVSNATYAALRPTLATSGGQLLAISTPNGQAGWYYNAWENGEGFERSRVVATECDRISSDFLRQEQESLPADVYASEYLCQFRSAEGSVFRYEDVTACFDSQLIPIFPNISATLAQSSDSYAGFEIYNQAVELLTA